MISMESPKKTEMVSIGIDPSINSTGVCVMGCSGTFDSIHTKYYIIGSKPSKATVKFMDEHDDKFLFIEYGKLDYNSEKEYSVKELVKTKSMFKSAEALQDILTWESPDIAVMEGVSYGSTSGASIVDLAGLNFIYRLMEIDEVQEDLVIVSPMEIKKFATGNGGVDKDIMVKVWSLCEHIEIDPKAKIDDLADAYFMALYGVCKWFPDLANSLELPKVEIPKKTRKAKKPDPNTALAMEAFYSL